MEKLNECIIKIRVELQKTEIKKSGKNSHAGFTYFELADFLPTLNNLMLEYGINDIITIDNDYAKLMLVKGDEVNEYTIPFKKFETPLSNNGKKSMQDIQYLGALNTYYKRYLYLNAFGITDGEVIDGMNNNELVENYKVKLSNYCNDNGIDIKDFAKEYKLNAKTTNEEAKAIWDKINAEC